MEKERMKYKYYIVEGRLPVKAAFGEDGLYRGSKFFDFETKKFEFYEGDEFIKLNGNIKIIDTKEEFNKKTAEIYLKYQQRKAKNLLEIIYGDGTQVDVVIIQNIAPKANKLCLT